MFEVSIEVFFDDQRVMLFSHRRGILSCEAFSESVSALVVFVFEAAFPEDFVNIPRVNDEFSVLFEEFPNGVVFRGSGVYTDDFSDKGLPSVWAVVQPVVDWFSLMRRVSCVITWA